MEESCKIFQKYGLDDFFESDHDIIFGPSIDTPFTEHDWKTLENLGWYRSEEWDCWIC